DGIRAFHVTGVQTCALPISADVPLILELIRALAEYERLADECEATEERLQRSLFAPIPHAEVLIAELDGKPAGFALFCHNYSTRSEERRVGKERRPRRWPYR